MVNYIPEAKLYPLEKTGKKFRKMADFAGQEPMTKVTGLCLTSRGFTK